MKPIQQYEAMRAMQAQDRHEQLLEAVNKVSVCRLTDLLYYCVQRADETPDDARRKQWKQVFQRALDKVEGLLTV